MKKLSWFLQIMLLLVAWLAFIPAQTAMAAARDDSYEFTGTVESFPAGFIGDWKVSGVTIHVTTSTRIDQEHGSVTIGATVEVKGDLNADGSVTARKIEVKHSSGGGSGSGSEVKFYGTIESLPSSGWIGDWVVSAKTVHVTGTTRIEEEHGLVSIGASVEVKGVQNADGSVTAYKIEVKQSSGGGSNNGSKIKFYGTVESLPASGLVGDWMIGGRTVHVSANTRIEQEHDRLVVGAYVKVKGYLRADGSVDATKIEVKHSASGGGGSGNKVKFYGTIESLPAGGLIGTWVVSGRTVVVSATTKIEAKYGQPAVGAYVEVEGVQNADASINAYQIEVRNSATNNGSSTIYIKFYGNVETLPANGWVGDWTVSGRTVHVTATTILELNNGSVQSGAWVEVKGIQQADGSITALKIELKR